MPEECLCCEKCFVLQTFALSAPSKNQPAGNVKQLSPIPNLRRGCSVCFCVLLTSVHWCQDSIWKGDCMLRRSSKQLWPFPWQKFEQTLHPFRFLNIPRYLVPRYLPVKGVKIWVNKMCLNIHFSKEIKEITGHFVSAQKSSLTGCPHFRWSVCTVPAHSPGTAGRSPAGGSQWCTSPRSSQPPLSPS